MKYYPALKKEANPATYDNGDEPGNILLSEIRQTLPNRSPCRTSKSRTQESRGGNGAAWGPEGGVKRETLVKGEKFQLCGKNRVWRTNAQHGDHSTSPECVNLQLAERVAPKCSHHTHTHTHTL